MTYRRICKDADGWGVMVLLNDGIWGYENREPFETKREAKKFLRLLQEGEDDEIDWAEQRRNWSLGHKHKHI
jgi:hypothetical protein